MANPLADPVLLIFIAGLFASSYLLAETIYAQSYHWSDSEYAYDYGSDYDSGALGVH